MPLAPRCASALRPPLPALPGQTPAAHCPLLPATPPSVFPPPSTLPGGLRAQCPLAFRGCCLCVPRPPHPHCPPFLSFSLSYPHLPSQSDPPPRPVILTPEPASESPGWRISTQIPGPAPNSICIPSWSPGATGPPGSLEAERCTLLATRAGGSKGSCPDGGDPLSDHCILRAQGGSPEDGRSGGAHRASLGSGKASCFSWP